MTAEIEVFIEKLVARFVTAEDPSSRISILIAELGQQVQLAFGAPVQEAIMVCQGTAISLALPRGPVNTEEWRAFARARLTATFDDVALIYSMLPKET